MGKMQDEIKGLRRQNRHLENIVQRHLHGVVRQRLCHQLRRDLQMVAPQCVAVLTLLAELYGTGGVVRIHAAPKRLVHALRVLDVLPLALDKERGVYVIGAMKKDPPLMD